MDARLKNVIHGSVASFFARALIFACNIAIISLLSRYFSPDQFGKWALIHQAALMISVFDFGIGGGCLRNALVREEQKDELFFAMFAFALVIFLPLALLTTPYLMGAVTLILFRAPFAISGMGFYAFEESHIKGWLEALEIATLFLTIALAVHFSFTLKAVVRLYYCTYCATMVFNFSLFLRRRKWRWHFPSLSRIKNRVKPLFSESLLFWAHSLFSIALFSSSPFLIAKATTVRDAGEYTLLLRLFNILLGVQLTLTTPLWSAFTRAYHEKDHLWIIATFKKALLFSGALLVGGGAFLSFFHTPLIQLWTGKVVHKPLLALLLGVVTLLQGITHATSLLLNAQSLVKRQVLALILSSSVQIFLSCFLFSSAIGVVLSLLISYTPACLVNCGQVYGCIKGLSGGHSRRAAKSV